MQQETFKQWGLLELFGHTRIAGLISEQTIGGASFIRIDVPATSDGSQPAFTRLLGSSAIYAINPLDEATTRTLVDNIGAAPVTPYDMRNRLKQMVDERMGRLGAHEDNETDEELTDLNRY